MPSTCLTRLCVYILLCCGVLSGTCQARDYITEQAYFIAPTAGLTFEQVRQQTFTPYQNPLAKSYQKEGTWVRLRLDPADQVGRRLILRIGLPNYLDEVALFDPEAEPGEGGGQSLQPRYSGDLYAPDPDDYNSVNLGFMIPAGDKPRDLYLRLRTVTIHYLDVGAYTPQDAYRMDMRQLLFSILSCCFLILVLGWAILIGSQDRETVIGLFIVKQISSVVYVFLVLGLGRVFVPEWLETTWLDKLTDVSKIITVTSVIVFELAFLREFKPPLWLWKTVAWPLVLSAGAIALFVSGDAPLAQQVNTAAGMLSTIQFFFLSASGRIWRDTPDQAAYILPRWSLVLYHGILLLIVILGLAPFSGLQVDHTMTIGASHIFHAQAFVTSVLILALLHVRHLQRAKRSQNALLKLAGAEQEAQDQARRREEQSRFLATTSHELRTPLNGILGMTELALAPRVSDRERVEYLQKIAGSGQVLMEILSEVLDLAKIEAGKLDLEQIDFDLNDLLSRLNTTYAELARQRGLRFSLDRASGLPRYVRGDPVHLQQILGNFISNALKFTQNGSISLSGQSLTDNRLRFEVRDTGIGISPEAQQRLFQPYVQAESSTTRRYGGTGLGLSICKKLAELMGGEVGVSSVMGEGSCFWVEVALQPAQTVPASVAAASADDGLPDIQGIRVLLADDSEMNRMIVTRMLETAQVRVEEVSDGEQAVAAVRRALDEGNVFDVILMDVRMPVMDGLDATRQIRQWPDGAHLPIIALTAGAMREERDAALEAGVSDFATKPLSMKQLLERIHGVLQKQG